MAATFMIIGKNDIPLYDADFSTTSNKETSSHLNQFIIYASLDLIDQIVWTKSNMYLKTVDKFNDSQVSAFVTAGHVRFVLLHDGKSEDNIKHFFTDVYTLFARILMNPFYEINTPIDSIMFDKRVKQAAKKWFK